MTAAGLVLKLTAKAAAFYLKAKQMRKVAEHKRHFMSIETGGNAIKYQLMNEAEPLPWDTGYITTEDLYRLKQSFVVA